MTALAGSLAFLAPSVLVALLALPLIWWLLRAIPPAPARRAFPGVRLLLGLRDKDRMPERTPWWLLLLRVLALGAAILAFSGPVLNPRVESGDGPLIVLLDGGWGDAPDWADRMDRVAAELEAAKRAGRPVAVLSMSEPPPEEPPLLSAGDWTERLAGLEPQPWSPQREAWAEWVRSQSIDFDTLWLADGIGDGAEADLASALLARGAVTLVRPSRAAVALTPARLEDGSLVVTALRADTAGDRVVSIGAVGADPNGVERPLASAAATFAPGESATDVAIDLPLELRNRVARVSVADDRSAAGVVLADDSVRRRKVALLAGRAVGETQQLMDPLYYLRNALEPFSEVIEAPLPEMMQAAPDLLVMADVGALSGVEAEMVSEWVDNGGVLLRFAGPRLAGSGVGQIEEDPLLPVRLRAGGRSVGGAMSWGAPRKLRPFPEGSLFDGLGVPDDVAITAQVMAQPGPELSERVMAALEDGTPLVTGRDQGDGRVILVHVTANAEWSSLPLSGLFVNMLERLTQSAGGIAGDQESLEGAVWTPVSVLDAFGELRTPTLAPGVPGEQLATSRSSPEAPPGIYGNGDRRVAINTMRDGDRLQPLAALPDAVALDSLDRPEEVRLAPWFLSVAIGLLVLDVLATLFVSGKLWHGRSAGTRAMATSIAVLAVLALGLSDAAFAQDDAKDQEAAALYAANQTVLAYVKTGSPRIDAISEAGLWGLSLELYNRTAIEPADPVGIDLETDEIAFYPFLYWPVTEATPTPSPESYAKLNDFLRFGGMILFDTLDADLQSSTAGMTPNGRALQRIALKLDVPPLEPAPSDHVLTRTFYLLQEFPGRFHGGTVWVEAAPNAEQLDGMPFRNLNDGVSPIVVGGNDWASAWAVNKDGQAMFPVGRGIAGERQREIAVRFGVNLIMYVMTGNYKSDQVHVPALLDRLGQ